MMDVHEAKEIFAKGVLSITGIRSGADWAIANQIADAVLAAFKDAGIVLCEERSLFGRRTLVPIDATRGEGER